MLSIWTILEFCWLVNSERIKITTQGNERSITVVVKILNIKKIIPIIIVMFSGENVDTNPALRIPTYEAEFSMREGSPGESGSSGARQYGGGIKFSLTLLQGLIY